MTAPKKPTTKRQPAKKAASKASTQPSPEAPESSTGPTLDASNRKVPEPEVEAHPEEGGVPERHQEDYQAGHEAAQRGWPVRVCPHDGNESDTEATKAARWWWLKGYHAYAHPQSNSTVVPEDGNTNGGVYRGTY